MPKNTTQASGVVGGTMDVSRETVAQVSHVTDAGAVLSDRHYAGLRASKLAALKAKQAAARTPAKKATRAR